MDNTTFLNENNVFCLSFPHFYGQRYDGLNGYFERLANNLKACIEDGSFNKGCLEGKRGGAFYIFFDLLSVNDRYISGLLVLCGYELSELVIFRCCPITVEPEGGKHLSISRLGKKMQKDIPYCVIDNTVYRVENLYSGQRTKMRKKNYRSLINLVAVSKISQLKPQNTPHQ